MMKKISISLLALALALVGCQQKAESPVLTIEG
jgi:uncharacterized lipoprotein NlpE involved in copper resistance